MAGGLERGREVSGKVFRERERKRGEVIKLVGPVTVINWDPHKFSPDLNLAWIQKRLLGVLKFPMRPT